MHKAPPRRKKSPALSLRGAQSTPKKEEEPRAKPARCTKHPQERRRAPRKARAVHKTPPRRKKSPALSLRGAQSTFKKGKERRAKPARCTKHPQEGRRAPR
ncbi:hypothetical protein Q75_16215 [Bacillus coahuilensis p1.1.43]|uniref:Uncharacterized protein n=1 Tax=Bacillus coahuilensis p1.1.43 TaxID=1150625 RepID=A0A147K485_9BACI|nr:hypothetical protein Q75_16215 [Bacillus coahuilensis p1.1.43]